jgi:hypothetical protein
MPKERRGRKLKNQIWTANLTHFQTKQIAAAKTVVWTSLYLAGLPLGRFGILMSFFITITQL